MLNFDLIKSYLEQAKNVKVPTNVTKLGYYSDFYDDTSASFIRAEDIEKVLKETSDMWLDNTKLAVELFSGDCRNIKYIQELTGCEIKGIDIQKRDIQILEDEFLLADCTKELPVSEVDAFFSMNGGIAILSNIELLCGHFKAVANALKKGGIYYTEYCKPMLPFEIFETEFHDSNLYKIVEIVGFDKYVFHEFLIMKEEMKAIYSCSTVQAQYNFKVYETIAAEYGLQLYKHSPKFDDSFMIFRKI